MAKTRVESDPVIKFFITIIGITVIVLVLKELSSIFLPFVIAYFLFFVFNPLNEFLASKKIPSGVLILLNIAITFLTVYIISSVIVDSFMQLGAALPEYQKRLNDIVSGIAVSAGVKDPYFTHFSIEKVVAKINLQDVAGGVFTSTFSLLGDTLFVLFFFIFISTGHDNIYEAIKKRYVNRRVKKLLKPNPSGIEHVEEHHEEDHETLEQKEKKLEKMFKAITEQIQKYLITKIAINLLAGILTFIALSIIGVDYPLVWALFVFLFNFIPTIGSAAALVLPSLMALIQFGTIGVLITVIITLAVIQTIAFNLLEPKIMGNRLNINPLLILLSLLIWGYIWGIVGMLLSVPLTAVIKIIIGHSESKNMIFINDLMS